MRISGSTAIHLMRFSLLLSLIVFSVVCEARFQLEDAELVDQEERLSTENYNDIISYRYPIHFIKIWDEHDIGYLLNAGSLNASRFQYEEKIKFHVNLDGNAGVSLTREREEDFLEERRNDAVKIFANPLPYLRLSVLGDGGSKKQFGDLGAAIAFWRGRHSYVELFYWSVDHFYDEKRMLSEDERIENTHTKGIKLNWDINNFKITALYEYDHPLDWMRRSRNYRYSYSRQIVEGDVKFSYTDDKELIFYGQKIWKSEAKTFLQSGNHKGFSRSGQFIEFAHHWYGQEDYSAGLINVSRLARYAQTGDFENFEELVSPDRSERKEWALYGTRYMRFDGANHQLGFHSNRVTIEESNENFFEWENKLQWLIDFEVKDGCDIVLNTTWDLDQLYKDYPFEGEKTFKPWGGGNIQFIAVF